jgi:hypothetical protein
MEYSTQNGFPVHQDCANFRDGICTLNGVVVNPNGVACPNFTPKSKMGTPQTTKAYPEIRQHYQSNPPQIGYSLSPQYAYPPGIGHGQGYPTPQYRRGYSYSSATALRQGGAGFLFMSSGRRGRGGGGRGRGRGKMGGFAAGPGGSCVCPNCGYNTSHVIGTPCYQQTCPKCGSRMTRGS